jgi:hypothetical protein
LAPSDGYATANRAVAPPPVIHHPALAGLLYRRRQFIPRRVTSVFVTIQQLQKKSINPENPKKNLEKSTKRAKQRPENLTLDLFDNLF